MFIVRLIQDGIGLLMAMPRQIARAFWFGRGWLSSLPRRGNLGIYLWNLVVAASRELGRRIWRLRTWWLSGWIRRSVLGAGVISVASAALLVTWIAYIPATLKPGASDLWVEFERAADRARGVAMYDSVGRYLGIIHSETERDHLGEYTTEELAPGGFFPDHKAVPVADAPPHFWRCLVYLEDRHRNTWWRNPQGVDAFSLVRIPFTERGGSTIEMQIARSIWMLHRDNSDRLTRKLREWRAAPVLNHYLTADGDERRLRAWAAQHIPLIRATGDEQDIYGVEAAAHFLFGKRASEMDAAEQLLLAAAVQRPIRWRREGDRQLAVLDTLIGTADQPGRARLCTSASSRLRDGEPVIADGGIRQTAIRRLGEMARGIGLVPNDPAFEDALEPLIHHPEGPRTGPMRLGLALVPNVQREALAEMIDAFARADEVSAGEDHNQLTREGVYDRHPWRGRADEIHLTLDVARNLAFRRVMRAALLEMSSSFDADRLRPGSLPYLQVSADGTSEIRTGDTPVMIAAADARGRIVRYYNSSSDTVYMGRAGQRRNVPGFGNGAYEVESETRQIGSVSKIAAALLLAEAGNTDNASIVSNECLRGVTRNCWVSDPNDPTSVVTMDRAFAQSLNAAITRRLSERVDPAISDRLMTSLGFRLPNGRSSSAIDLALGRYVGRPNSVHHLAAIALAVARGQVGPVPAPHFIETYFAFDTTREVRPDGAERQFTYATHQVEEASSEQSAFVRRVLSRPLCDVEHGTLARLRNWCAQDNPGVRIHIAKTGTVSAGRPAPTEYNESDWWVAGGVEFADGRAYSYVVSVGSGSARQAFAANLGSASIAPLVDLLLTDLLNE